jgi:hypothetical protein
MSDIAAEIVGSSQPGGDSQPEAPVSFEGAHERALAMLEGNSTEVEQSPDAPSEVVADAPNVDGASAAQLATLSDDQLVEVTVDGETVQMPWKEARAGIQRQAHYTKNMQSLRQEQAAFEANRTQLAQAAEQRDALAQVLQNEQLLQQFLQRQFPHLLQQGQQIAAAAEQVDPSDIATVGQLQHLQQQYAQHMEQMAASVRQEIQQELINTTTELETRQATAKLATNINGTIGEIFTSHPYLKELIPNAEENLRFEVMRLQPTTAEETLQAFKDVAAGWVETYKRHQTSQSKQAVVAKQKLVSNNIQGPGGAAVTPTPNTFKTTHKMTGKQDVDWKAVNAAAMALFDK